jgi:hypothetical protein
MEALMVFYYVGLARTMVLGLVSRGSITAFPAQQAECPVQQAESPGNQACWKLYLGKKCNEKEITMEHAIDLHRHYLQSN